MNVRVKVRIGLLVVLVLAFGLMFWADGLISDPDDQCNDQSVSVVARFISCRLEGR